MTPTHVGYWGYRFVNGDIGIVEVEDYGEGLEAEWDSGRLRPIKDWEGEWLCEAVLPKTLEEVGVEFSNGLYRIPSSVDVIGEHSMTAAEHLAVAAHMMARGME